MSNPLGNLNERSKRTLEILVKTGIVPTFTAFDITEEMISKAIEIYGTLGGSGTGKFQYGLERKLHGINLLKLKFSRGAKISDCREGMVYLIANPSWPNHLKIGMTMDLETRLSSYQTYDPFKRFYVKHYEFCLDRRRAERQLLDKFNIHALEGEWIKYKNALEVIRTLRNF